MILTARTGKLCYFSGIVDFDRVAYFFFKRPLHCVNMYTPSLIISAATKTYVAISSLSLISICVCVSRASWITILLLTCPVLSTVFSSVTSSEDPNIPILKTCSLRPLLVNAQFATAFTPYILPVFISLNCLLIKFKIARNEYKKTNFQFCSVFYRYLYLKF